MRGHVGLLADRVLDIVSFEPRQVQPVPRVAQASRVDFLSGLVTVDGAMLALIDLQNLLAVTVTDGDDAISSRPEVHDHIAEELIRPRWEHAIARTSAESPIDLLNVPCQEGPSMLKLSNIRIPVRIAIACLLPLLAFTAFAVKGTVRSKRETFSTMQGVAVVVEAAPMISSLVSELQNERGASTGFVDSKGKSFADAMRSQRPQTDKALSTGSSVVCDYAQSAAGTKFARDLEAANSRLARDSADMRTSIDALTIDAAKTIEYLYSRRSRALSPSSMRSAI